MLSKYTMTIKEIIESGVDIFKDWSYPIYSEDYRSSLNNKIIRHFYFKEIGFETVGRFKYELKTLLNEIMPYYNKIYDAINLDQRILNNYDVTDTTSSISKDLESDTPQGQVDLNTSQYVSGIQQSENTVTHNSSGNIGVQTDAEAVAVYVKNQLNVDLMILSEINELFMKIY